MQIKSENVDEVNLIGKSENQFSRHERNIAVVHWSSESPFYHASHFLLRVSGRWEPNLLTSLVPFAAEFRQ